ncbi:MAG: LysR family transcriptional regulator [Pseudomonadota bacterium]|nr:LysR family transcriptional regulator [Pseudomonadota bacterium]
MNDPLHTPDALDWRLLQVFLAAAEAGSLGRAAQAMGQSQPTLSRRLAALEAAVGQPLFERTPRGLALTPAGHALRAPALQMQAQLAHMRTALDRHAREMAGTVRITASAMMSHHVLLPALAAVRERFAQIQLELVPDDATADLLQREADIAVRMYRPREPGLIARRLVDVPLGLYAHRTYLRRKGPVTQENMATHDWIGMDRSDMMLRGFAQGGWPVTRDFFALRTDDSPLAWQAVCLGLGVGVGLQQVAERTPHVQRVLPDVPLPAMPSWLVVHRELRGTPRLRAVFDALAQALSQPAPAH